MLAAPCQNDGAIPGSSCAGLLGPRCSIGWRLSSFRLPEALHPMWQFALGLVIGVGLGIVIMAALVASGRRP